jgi:hypothetical protein
MKRLFTLVSITVFVLSSCETRPKNLDEFLVDISEFSIDNTILEDGHYVEILGSSGNLTGDHDFDFYYLIVVRSEETGDTINVLTTTFYQTDLNDSRTQFISNSSTMGKLIENAQNTEEIQGLNVKDIGSKSFDKVLYDTEYIQMDVREYPAVTGNLGYTIDSDFEDVSF